MHIRKVLMAVGVGMALAMSAHGASAQEEETPDNEGYFMRDVLGWAGLVPEARPSIQYRERPPLVLPPSAGNQLPPPIDHRTTVGSKAPNWPNDPDAAAAARNARDAKIPRTETEAYRAEKHDRMSPRELQAGRRAGAGIPQTPTGALPEGSRAANYVDPDFLRANGRLEDEKLVPGQEPSRKMLTDPPTGLRKPSMAAKNVAAEPVVRVDESKPGFFTNRNNQ